MSHGYNVAPLSEANSGIGTDGEELIVSSGSEGSPRIAKRNGGWTVLLLLAAVTTTIGSCVPAGYNIGVVNAPAEIIKKFCNETVLYRYHRQLSPIALEALWSSIVSIFVIGGVIGSFAGSASADRWGRKGSIIMTDILGLVASLCFILSKEVSSVEALLIGRFIIGLSSGLSTAVTPMYLTELAPLKLRGATGVLCPVGLTVGVLLSQVMGLESVLGRENTWHYLLALYSILNLATVFIMPRLPESPKYLAAIRRQEDRAINELVRIRRCKEELLIGEIEQMRKDIATEMQQIHWTTNKVWRDSELRLPLLLVCALQAGQQFSGINAVFYYSIKIFESAGLSTTQSKYANLGAGAFNLLAGIISIYTMNRFGRRRLLLISTCSVIICLCLLVLSIALSALNSDFSYVSVVAVLSYVLIYGLGLGPIPYFIGTELFQVGPRPVAMAWGSMSNWSANFAVGMLFPFVQSAIGEYSFLIFILITAALTVLVIIYFPETKDRPETEISELLKYGFKSNIKKKISRQETTRPLAETDLESPDK
ncbi:UNVERIFIED_CONTAM: hypothetical protein PYX00_010357 [Menopon gallinae]|uniref:Major facilitator superfamily (MFS) profile domain-containing protein n=1 Tax=Menopon gallinae TaxID=328185 RepID=A0AAW2HF42_9NEOP